MYDYLEFLHPDYKENEESNASETCQNYIQNLRKNNKTISESVNLTNTIISNANEEMRKLLSDCIYPTPEHTERVVHARPEFRKNQESGLSEGLSVSKIGNHFDFNSTSSCNNNDDYKTHDEQQKSGSSISETLEIRSSFINRQDKNNNNKHGEWLLGSKTKEKNETKPNLTAVYKKTNIDVQKMFDSHRPETLNKVGLNNFYS